MRRPSLLSAVHSRRTRRRSILYDSGVWEHWGLTFGELPSLAPRPSPLTYATLHFCRFSPIKVRFLVREAVEHDGPYVFRLPLAVLAPSDLASDGQLHKLI